MAMSKRKGAARPEDNQNEIASSEELGDILTTKIGNTRLPESEKDEFVDTGIIAERRYTLGRKKEQEVDLLVEGLPVWRRHGSDNGVDKKHLAVWEKFKSDKNNVMQAGSKQYGVTMHRTHPLFERWTGAKGVFENGLKEVISALLTRKHGCDDVRDRLEAMEMLGHILGKCVMEHVEDVNVMNDLAITVTSAMTNSHTQANDEIACGQAFLQLYDINQRQEVAERLLADEKASEFHSWTIAFCIAMLPMVEFLKQWQENTATISRAHALSNRLRAYRLAIGNFLNDYHEQTREKKSFIYTLRTYSTLSEMLRTKTPDMLEDTKGSYAEQDRLGENEGKEDLGVEQAHNSTFEENPEDEHADPSGESDDEEDRNTKENEIRAIEEAAKRNAVFSKPGKRVTRPPKRRNPQEEDAGRGKRMKKAGKLAVL